ncbi:hypothetical protein DFH09DRAFT_1343050 [Mycena vulgaris]|nr:hypothetical protein DFH09DRAFT_1343050 [Mycena vulgaris]
MPPKQPNWRELKLQATIWDLLLLCNISVLATPNLAAPTYPCRIFSLTPPAVLSLAEIQILFRRRPADHHFGLHLVHLILGLLQVGMRRTWDDEKVCLTEEQIMAFLGSQALNQS